MVAVVKGREWCTTRILATPFVPKVFVARLGTHQHGMSEMLALGKVTLRNSPRLPAQPRPSAYGLINPRMTNSTQEGARR
jgi:hypothetical protein